MTINFTFDNKVLKEGFVALLLHNSSSFLSALQNYCLQRDVHVRPRIIWNGDNVVITGRADGQEMVLVAHEHGLGLTTYSGVPINTPFGVLSETGGLVIYVKSAEGDDCFLYGNIRTFQELHDKLVSEDVATAAKNVLKKLHEQTTGTTKQ